MTLIRVEFLKRVFVHRCLGYIRQNKCRMSLSQAINSYLLNGKASWNDLEFSNKFASCKCELYSVITSEKFQERFRHATGFKLADAKTFVLGSKANKTDGVESSFKENGHPLQLDEDYLIPDDAFKAKLIFVDLLSAQTFLSCFIQLQLETLLQTLPLLILLDRNCNKQNICMFYLNAVSSDGNLHSRRPEVPNLTIKTITCLGPLSKKAWEAKLTKESEWQEGSFVENLAYQLAFSPHMLSADGSLSENSAITIKSFQEHELFSDSDNLMQSIDQYSNIASISLNVSCNTVSSLFSLDAPHISHVSVRITPVPGDARSPAHNLFKEVAVLNGLLRAFDCEGHVQWAECADENASKQDYMMEKLKEIFTPRVASYGNDMASSCDDDEVFNLLAPRVEFDFTENVWNILKHVQSFQHLVEGLQFIFKEIERGNTNHLWLHEDGQSILATAVQDSYQDNVTKLSLSGLTSLQILIEIGLDKLKRDYFNFFISHRLSIPARLNQFFEVDSEKEAGQVLKSKIQAIEKLHHVVELASLCHSFLHLPLTLIHKIVRCALQDYVDVNVKVEQNKTFSFAVPYNDVRKHLEDSTPCTWKLEAAGSNTNGKCHGSACWTLNYPFEGLFPSDLVSFNLNESSFAENEDDELAKYYLTSATHSLCPLFN